MNDAEKLAEMGTDARKWARGFVEAWNTRPMDEATIPEEVSGFWVEMEEFALTWFANAIEAGRDAGQDKVPGDQMTKAERAIRALRECADALEDMPFRMTIMGGLFGQLPINRIDQLRAEAGYIVNWMDMTAETTAPPLEKS